MFRLQSSTRRSRPGIGPEDHGSMMTLEQFQAARDASGVAFELVEGVLSASPTPKPRQEFWVQAIEGALESNASRHFSHVNYVATCCEVNVPIRPGARQLRPDVAVNRNFPHPLPNDSDEVCPVLVIDVISPRPEKNDAVRNRQLYWSVEGILEYWVADVRDDLMQPAMMAMSRRAGATNWDE